MNRRILICLWAAIIVASLVLVLLRNKRATPTNSNLPAITAVPTGKALSATNKAVEPTITVDAPKESSVATNAAQPQAQASPQTLASLPSENPPTAPDLPPLTVLDNCRVAVHNYHERFGENPVGNNAEITAALRGSNPKQVNFIRDDAGLRVNEKGEIIDAYGTPFFFHQLSADLMEIRSAGQDRKLFTFDDIVTR